MTTKNTTTTTATSSTVETETKTSPSAAQLVGTMPADVEPVPVVLSHHLRIEGTDYAPGSKIRISPDFARRLRAQGYIART